MTRGTPIDPEHILPGDNIIAWGPDRDGKRTEHEYVAFSKRHQIFYAEGYNLVSRPGEDTEGVRIDDVFELLTNLTDTQIEPAARALYDLQSRGNTRGYTPFDNITEDEYDDYMTKAQWTVEGFLRGLETREDA